MLFAPQPVEKKHVGNPPVLLVDVGLVEQPGWQPLAAPVDHDRCVGSLLLLGRDDRVFLDIFGAPAEQQHRAGTGWCTPDADADAHPVGRCQPIGRPLGGTRTDIGIKRGGLEGHVI